MKRRHSNFALLENPVMIGTLAVLITVVAVVISYNADRGLPFVRTYPVSVDVPDAAKLVRGDEVRIGGARVGQVAAVTAMSGRPPFARIRLRLTHLQPLPVDSTVLVRPRSILGSKYVAITLGSARRTVAPNGVLALAQAHPTVEIDDAFRIFDPATRRGLRDVIGGFGDAVAGRGTQLNETIGNTRALLGPLERTLRLLASPRTHLSGLLRGAAQVGAALAPVSQPLAALVDETATTFGALAAAPRELGATLDALPGAERSATHTLAVAAPVLADAAAIARAIRPGTRELARSTRLLAGALESGVAPLRRTPALAALVAPLAGSLDALTRSGGPFSNAVAALDATVVALGGALRVLGPAQTVCNVSGIYMRNLASAVSEGDQAGSWLRFDLITGSPQNTQSATPDGSLHADPAPREDAHACQVGNEPYRDGQRIGDPGPTPTTVDRTAPPPEVTAAAQRAGLLAPVPGARP